MQQPNTISKTPTLTFGLGLIIFFLSLVALVAEFILYLLTGKMTGRSGTMGMVGPAVFFFWLMFMTILAGVLAPICGAIEQFSKHHNLGIKIMIGSLCTIGVLLAMLMGVAGSYLR